MTHISRISSPTLWLIPLFLILLAFLPVDRTNRDSRSTKQPSMVCIFHFGLLLWKSSFLSSFSCCFKVGPFKCLLVLWCTVWLSGARVQILHKFSPSNQSWLHIRLQKSVEQEYRVERRKRKVQKNEKRELQEQNDRRKGEQKVREAEQLPVHQIHWLNVCTCLWGRGGEVKAGKAEGLVRAGSLGWDHPYRPLVAS